MTRHRSGGWLGRTRGMWVLVVLLVGFATVAAASCPPGLTPCGSKCVDLKTDRDNCGTCGRRIEAGYICDGGQRELSCQAGLKDCGGWCVDLLNDEQNCGGCRRACNPRQRCSKGRCIDIGTPTLPGTFNVSPRVPTSTPGAPAPRTNALPGAK